MLPGRIYALDLFKAWEGVFFTEEQCIYLGVWHDNVRNLRSDGQTGLAIFGLWNVLCYWLQKAQYPDDMQDVPPSELAWNYIRKTERWVTTQSAPQHGPPSGRADDDQRAARPMRCSSRRRLAIRSAAPTRAFGCGKRGGRVTRTTISSTRTATRCSVSAAPTSMGTRARLRAYCQTLKITPSSSCKRLGTASARIRAAHAQRPSPRRDTRSAFTRSLFNRY